MIKASFKSEIISKKIETLLKPDKLWASWANRVLPKLYLNAQQKRWMTEGSSEGARWKPLNARYATYKRKKWASSPGAGTKMLVASGRLFFEGITPGGAQYRKIVGNRDATFSLVTPYGRYVDDGRNFTNWSRVTNKSFADSFRKYLTRGLS